MSINQETHSLHNRFRGFYPVVIDIETAGFNAQTDALLEIGITTLSMDENGWLKKSNKLHFHIIPFQGSMIQPNAIAFNKIDPFNPLRGAIEEHEALTTIFSVLTRKMKIKKCTRSIVVGHNANFDHKFLMAAIKRTGLKNHLFHPFVIFDTAALSGLIVGQTVLAKACKAVGVFFNNKNAHSALYDSEKTAELFCALINRLKKLGGWPP